MESTHKLVKELSSSPSGLELVSPNPQADRYSEKFVELTKYRSMMGKAFYWHMSIEQHRHMESIMEDKQDEPRSQDPFELKQTEGEVLRGWCQEESTP